MKFRFPPAPITALPIVDADDFFAVRRVYCVGRNYAEHALEMGHSEREAPFFFAKPADALVINPSAIAYPSMTKQLHHEVELVIAIGADPLAQGFEISPEKAWDFVFGYALGVDLTKRDLQAEYKAKSRPWDLAKGFDQSAPISSIITKQQFGEISNLPIELAVNGEIKQQASIEQMIWSIPEIISELSKHIELKAGDLIFTGTPSGVGEIKKGQRLNAKLLGLSLDFTLV